MAGAAKALTNAGRAGKLSRVPAIPRPDDAFEEEHHQR